MTRYAELAVTSNFSFLRGASHPQELVARADALGLAAIGIADRNSLAGVVRAYREMKERPKSKLKLLVGARLVTTDGFETIAYPMDRAAYGRLCRLLTEGKRRAENTECHLSFEEILAAGEGQVFIAMPPDEPVPPTAFAERLARLAQAAPGRAFLGACHRHRGDEPRRLGLLAELGERSGAPMVAVNDVLFHRPERRLLADVVTCIREKCTIAEAGLRLEVHAERHLKSAEEMARLFADFPEAIERTVAIAGACSFSLGELKYEYPDEPVPPGKTAQQHLEDLAWAGAQWRYPKQKYPDGIPDNTVRQLREELTLIGKLKYPHYFLTVHDVVAHARHELKVLCQGRGSAANSAVCFCLGITEVDPKEGNLLFSRFLSENRGEPPDIDVDFEHERREEVIQYIYERYGRHRAAICATVIHYRARRAIGEVGKALGLTPDVTMALSRTVWGSWDHEWKPERVREAGLDPDNPEIARTVRLASEITGFPRHLSQHVGGFVLTRGRLDETVPIGNAAMDERTFIEWDKDDIDALNLMKVDVLALGMLSCLRRGLDLLNSHYHLGLKTMAELPQDEAVYAMLSQADSVGVFQVESRAQMSMLPRLKPKTFYDLVIEVAIVRPGPIQGKMVHPYLRRREGTEKVRFPHPSPEYGPLDELEAILGRTKGVPLFQEQAMQIAITAAGFLKGDADGLRKAMATFRHNGTVGNYEEKFVDGMVKRGYPKDFATRCFDQIKGFGEYGFPESHAASFALLVYVSAWIKCHYPDVFCAAILNSQPMGFYQPAQLVRDARRHGVEVREVDVNASEWDCTLEPAEDQSPHKFAVRLGFRLVQGLREEEIKSLLARRGNGYASIERLGGIAGVSGATIERLAEADAFGSLGLDRRAALWAARRLTTIGIEHGRDRERQAKPPLPLFAPHLGDEMFEEPAIALPAMPLQEHVVEDYRAVGLSLKEHPCSFFRQRLAELGAITNAEHRLDSVPQGSLVTVAGMVLTRQRPGTSKGVVFMTLEDETDIANIVVWSKVFEANRRVVMTTRLVAIRGRLQRAGLVVHVVAEHFIDLSAELDRLRDGEAFAALAQRTPQLELPLLKSRDFH
ncbi:error-prone DNA polymerase [Labrys wisconsinensis]|uniref:Error-prone DNA polymerase n=1 Tax=Labrys wisconsinensis TaxID=425677 RepID=A0ABU0J6A2_9HYPH|nr:error-prone DNA polymerase [Labrys wisconsinensis]MDQ0469793.1 error-prone DNA polymerase [Labrys wisconsinensis]